VMIVGQDSTYGVTYKWNSQGTDADLVLEGLEETIADANPLESRMWRYPSTGECWSCHRSENRVLGFRAQQLNFSVGGVDQLAGLAAAGVLNAASLAGAPAAMVAPSDTTATIAERASAYMASNCAPCHHDGASYLGGGQTWNAAHGVADVDRRLINAQHHNAPMASGLGLPFAPLVAPGNADGSLLFARMQTVDEDLRMPPLGRAKVDPLGVSIMREWITALP
jgi:hypothetical protein